MVLSEAAVKRGPTTARLCPDVPWREIRGLANRLRHEYDVIDVGRLWLLIEKDLPLPKLSCEAALRALSQDGSDA